MQNSKSVKFLTLVGVNLSVEQCSKTQEEEEDMSHVPYASEINNLMYAWFVLDHTFHMQWEY